MVSVIIPTRDSVQDLEALFAALAPAAVDGLVRQVLAADAGSTDATKALCEDVGAEVVEGPVVMAAFRARHDQLLFLPPAFRPRAGWEEGLRRHLERAGGRAVLAAEGAGWLARLSGRGGDGLLISKDDLERCGDADDLAVLRRRFSPGAKRL
jgi:hypothetical protein